MDRLQKMVQKNLSPDLYGPPTVGQSMNAILQATGVRHDYDTEFWERRVARAKEQREYQAKCREAMLKQRQV